MAGNNPFATNPAPPKGGQSSSGPGSSGPVSLGGAAPTTSNSSVVTGLTTGQLGLQVRVPKSFGSNQMVETTIQNYLTHLDPTTLNNYIQALVQAGFLSSNPGPSGVYDPATIMTGLGKALLQANFSNLDISTYLARADQQGQAAQAAAGAPPPSRFYKGGTAEVTLTQVPDVLAAADQVFQSVLGRHVTTTEAQQLTSILNGEEYKKGAADIATAQAQQAAYVEAFQGGATQGAAAGPGVGAATGTTGALPTVAANAPLGLAQFMAAIRQQESGGDYSWSGEVSSAGAHGAYQILGSNWPEWARQAGVDPSNTSQAAQDRVAAFQMTQLYHSYGGNWGAVAAAWYGGAGGAQAYLSGKGGAAQSNGPSINDYVASVMSKMAPPAIAKPAPASTTQTVQSQQAPPAPSAPAETPQTAPDGTPLNPVTSLPTLAPGQSGSVTVGQPLAFTTESTTGYPVTDTVLPPTATIVAAPSSPTALAEYAARYNNPEQYQVENLVGVLNAINSALKQNTGAAKAAGSPIKMGAA